MFQVSTQEDAALVDLVLAAEQRKTSVFAVPTLHVLALSLVLSSRKARLMGS